MTGPAASGLAASGLAASGVAASGVAASGVAALRVAAAEGGAAVGLDGGPLPARWGRSVVGRGVVDRAGLAGTPDPSRPPWSIVRADGDLLSRYRRLRRAVFVDEQGLFERHDLDEVDADPDAVVLVACDPAGAVLGGVRLAPVAGVALGWWAGSRLVVRADHRRGHAVGAALVRAACAVAEGAGALRFDAAVQAGARPFFERLGWVTVGTVEVAGRRHAAMRWPVGRVGRLAAATKAPLAALLTGLHTGGPGWIGDDAAPVAGSDLLAACDAIVPSMVERDPEWAGWCGVLVNVNDLAAMGADPVALLDAVAAPDVSLAGRILDGLRAGSAAWGVPIVGGHTQLGVPAALSVTALGRAAEPVPGGGGRPGDEVRLIADLGGSWRPGYAGRQWDSTTGRTGAELRALGGVVARLRPAAAKDVSMAGVVGTLGMLAEAGGCGAELDVSRVPRPAATGAGDWLTCFPGFAMLTADRPGRAQPGPELTGPATSATCGRLVGGGGVSLVWPDGERTSVLPGAVTGLGPATPPPD